MKILDWCTCKKRKLVWQQLKSTNSAPYRSSTDLQVNKQLLFIELKLLLNLVMIQSA